MSLGKQVPHSLDDHADLIPIDLRGSSAVVLPLAHRNRRVFLVVVRNETHSIAYSANSRPAEGAGAVAEARPLTKADILRRGARVNMYIARGQRAGAAE